MKFLVSLTFGIVTIFLSLLNLGIEEGSFKASTFVANVALGWQEITRFLLSPLNLIPIEGWSFEGWQLDALALIISIMTSFVANFWKFRKKFALIAIFYIGIYVVVLGSPSESTLDPDGLTATLNGIAKTFIGLSILTFLIIIWARDAYLGPDFRDRDIFIPIAKMWLGPFVSGLLLLILYLSGAIEVVSLFFQVS